MKNINRNNFFKSTIGFFEEVSLKKIDFNFAKPDYTSDRSYPSYRHETTYSQSLYFYKHNGVYRYSDHWSDVGSCFWAIDSGETPYEPKLGFCKWEDFGVILEYKTKNFDQNTRRELLIRQYSLAEGNLDIIGYPTTKEDVLEKIQHLTSELLRSEKIPILKEDVEYVVFEFKKLFKTCVLDNRMCEHPRHIITDFIKVIDINFYNKKIKKFDTLFNHLCLTA